MKRTPRRLVAVLAVIVLLSGLAAGSAGAAPAESQPAGTDAWTTASSDELAQFQAAEAQKWGRVIKAAGIDPE